MILLVETPADQYIGEYAQRLMPVWMDYISAGSQQVSKADALSALERVLDEGRERGLMARYGKPCPGDYVVCHGAHHFSLLMIDEAREIVFFSEALANSCAAWYAQHYHVPVQVMCMGTQFDARGEIQTV